MRNPGIHLLLLAILISSGVASASQNDNSSASKPKKETAILSSAAAPSSADQIENWKSLSDITTGLQPRPPFPVQKDDMPGFVRELIRVQWRMGDPIDLWVVRPKTSAKVPVILYLYSYPKDPDQFRDNGWCERATAGGFAAVGFASALSGQRYAYRAMKKWFVSEIVESMGSSAHDVQLVLNYLADRGDIDLDHAGMIGMGSGASIAILAAEADPRIKALDLLDPWGDWPDWMRESPAIPENERPGYETEEFLKSAAAVDPVAYLPLLSNRSLRLQQTWNEPVTPTDAKERIAAATPKSIQFVKYSNAQDLLKAWQAYGLSGWIKQQLRSETQPDEKMSGLPTDSNSPRN